MAATTFVFECTYPCRRHGSPWTNQVPTFNANHAALVEGLVIALTPRPARARVEPRTVRDEVWVLWAGSGERRGLDMFLRHEIVAEVLSSGVQFRRHSI